MRRQRLLALLAAVALSAAVSACGSDEELSTQIPQTSPDLTIPTGTTPVRQDATATHGDDDDHDDRPTTALAAAVVTPPAPVPPPAGAASPQTGGETPQTGGATTTGGTQAGGTEFESFCAENPGAC